MRKTKIVCTLGPASNREETVRQMMLAGMNVARFNFSHETQEEHARRFQMIEKLRNELHLPVATLLDTRGPEIRTGLMQDGRCALHAGDTLTLTTQDTLGTPERISITYPDLPRDISDGATILIDDGLVELTVLSHTSIEITCRVENDGVVGNRKGINVPGTTLSMPYISPKDRDDLLFGAKMGFDFVAASFTRCADDIREVRAILQEGGAPDCQIIAKIENAQGVENIDEILAVADGIMIARGDMGVEIPFTELPIIQKMLIRQCCRSGKPVITATQMLESMAQHPRPTRAEISDVANAIYDGTSAIMLSGETAAGLYPVEAVETMARIAVRTEKDINYAKRFRDRESTAPASIDSAITDAISHATVTTAMDLDAKIVTVTKTGQTARMLSKYRPVSRIIGCTPSERACRQMSLIWGVTPVLCQMEYTTDALVAHAVRRAVEEGLLKPGDVAVVTAGVPLGVSGNTNLLQVHQVQG